MSVQLYKHNFIAYEAVVSMLTDCGRAAVIHPTGTGKSYIAFKLIESCPGARFLWLSPSEYIFKTQMTNLLSEDSDFPVEQITFATYAKLMMMDEQAMKDLSPDYIILDEFHRCGAEVWGQGVQTLLRIHPDAKILGLSATAIRYLDNNRNMAEELFDGNIASEMTLGESIVRGILPTPTYVSTLFKYQNEIERYQKRINTMKAKGLQDTNQRYLDALRRTLEKSEGLDVIFQKHMTDKNGKYIVFCANVEHMREMVERVPEWFSGIDAEPHCYAVYSDSAESSKEFKQFKTDESDHLKLLFCIDMLNEGVHVAGISGVILFRPTVSPIIYKQQIGRALTAGTSNCPLIIDVVNNADNLSSIDALQDEMSKAVLFLRANGRGEEIVTESFEVEEQIQDCRKLFQELENSLNGTWEHYFIAAKRYFAENGDLLVPRRYVTEEGLSLGNWILTQRKVRAGKQLGTLTDAQIMRLDSIGMVWENILEKRFDTFFEAAKQYYSEHGALLVPVKYMTEDGMNLGVWIANLRQQYANGEAASVLDAERIERLNEIGMVWDTISFVWERNYAEALEYYKKYGSIGAVPCDYRTETDFNLGAWLQNLRSGRKGQTGNRTLSEEQILRLDAIGMRWGNKYEEQWNQAYEAAKKYYDKHGDLSKIPSTYTTPDGIRLRQWVQRQQYSYENQNKLKCGIFRLDENRIRMLNEIGLLLTKRDSWLRTYEIAKRYSEQYGTLEISQNEVFEDVWIGKWLGLQRKAKLTGELTEEQISLLDRIGYDWLTTAERQWNTKYRQAKQFYEENGHLRVTDSSLSLWIIHQRKKYISKDLSDEQIKLLNDIGMQWNLDTWNQYYESVKRYAAEHPPVNGKLRIPPQVKDESGLRIGSWVSNQKTNIKKGKLSEERIALLKAVGITIGSFADMEWNQKYQLLSEYVKENGFFPPAQYKTECGVKLGSWFKEQKRSCSRGRLSKGKQDLLESLGVRWSG